MWAYLDIRDQGTIERLNNGLIFDVSIGFDWDYVDQKPCGTLGQRSSHVALVTDPYLNDMDDFEQVDTMELARRHDEYVANVGFGNAQPSIIMMSKDKVMETKRMKFAKSSTTKTFAVGSHLHGRRSETTATIEPGAELEVPKEVERRS